ncbi:hypothetical protein [Pseudonocardia acaciae]|uniref:hypothetical protein n=1 Tax=Pseudonocardia acaciae TaxID=551276 RepID=UPI00055BC0A3|nr:hypothetical protein [Pseudonocardia acaciae]
MARKFEIITLRGDCTEEEVCPAVKAIRGQSDPIYVQGRKVTDPELLAAFDVPPGEVLSEVPRRLFFPDGD